MLSVCFLRFAEEEIRCKDVKIEHTCVSGLQISLFLPAHLFLSKYKSRAPAPTCDRVSANGSIGDQR